MNSKLLYKQIKEKIVEEIKKIGPNGKLPSRPELVKKYNVSRYTIDQAISELIGEKVLYSLDGSGTYVSPPAAIQTEIKTIGVIMPNINSQIYPEILRGIEDFAHQFNMNTIICNSYMDSSKQNGYIEKLIQSNVTGMIIFPAIDSLDQTQGYKLLKSHGVPYVLCGRGSESMPSPMVIIDNYKGGYIATKNLLDRGCRRIAYLFPVFYQTVEERLNGYLSALREAGIPADYRIIVGNDNPNHYQGSYDSMTQLLKTDDSIDGVVAFSDEIAVGAIQAIGNAGLKIPDEIKVIGNGDYDIGSTLFLKLSTVLYPKYEMGLEAAKLLVKLIEKKEGIPDHYRVILSPELILRET